MWSRSSARRSRGRAREDRQIHWLLHGLQVEMGPRLERFVCVITVLCRSSDMLLSLLSFTGFRSQPLRALPCAFPSYELYDIEFLLLCKGENKGHYRKEETGSCRPRCLRSQLKEIALRLSCVGTGAEYMSTGNR